MDERITRFKHCDPRLYPYLDKVFSRLPENLRDRVLDDEGFQFIADAELPDVCGRCYDFDRPVQNLLYLNTRALIQPEHRLLCSIAWEIAEFIVTKEGKGGDSRIIEELLTSWGFDTELNAMCFCDAVSSSPVFKSGYDWADRQSPDYLMLHFGLYFDEWNERGLVRLSDDVLKTLRSQVSVSRLLPGSARREQKEIPEGVSVEDVFVEGIMAAIKEMELEKHQK